jgi:hypothetical protein
VGELRWFARERERSQDAEREPLQRCRVVRCRFVVKRPDERIDQLANLRQLVL